MLTLRGDDKSIRRLVLLLLDNALKYTPTDGTIALRFAAQGRSLCLTVTNPTETALTPSELTRVFDRFYRIDPSRSSDTGGHGIRLSVAKGHCDRARRQNQADTQTGCDFRVTAIFSALTAAPPSAGDSGAALKELCRGEEKIVCRQKKAHKGGAAAEEQT